MKIACEHVNADEDYREKFQFQCDNLAVDFGDADNVRARAPVAERVVCCLRAFAGGLGGENGVR